MVKKIANIFFLSMIDFLVHQSSNLYLKSWDLSNDRNSEVTNTMK